VGIAAIVSLRLTQFNSGRDHSQTLFERFAMLGWIALFLSLIALIALAVFLFNEDEDTKAGGLATTLIAGVLSAILWVCAMSAYVDIGNVGVQVVFGEAQPRVLTEGISFPVHPFSSVKEMSARTENYWLCQKESNPVEVRASNGLLMPVDVGIPYRIEPSSAPWIYKNLGAEWVKTTLSRTLSNAAFRAGNHFTAEEIYASKRDQFAEKTKLFFEEELNKLLQENYKGQNPPERVVIFNQILIGHIGIPDTVKHAIESKLKADAVAPGRWNTRSTRAG
jgi:regulator of protease activity HflC (stomatin/prohibitin superfamily)